MRLAIGLLLFMPAPGQAADALAPDGKNIHTGKSDLRIAQPPKDVDDQTEAAGVPSWGLGPFVRCPENPLIEPRTDTTFFCPIQKTDVPWEEKNIVGAAAAVKDGKVYWLYRAEPINIHNSRVGLAISEDGVHFQRSPAPIIYPDEDAFKQYEWPGGTEDGRIVQREDGLSIYVQELRAVTLEGE